MQGESYEPEATTDGPSPATARPSQATMTVLRELYARGALLEIHEHAETLAERTPDADVFFRELSRRAGDFDDDAVRLLLEAP